MLSDEAIFTYKVDNVYAPEHEASVRFDDNKLGINWPIDPNKVLTSQKDLAALPFEEAEYLNNANM